MATEGADKWTGRTHGGRAGNSFFVGIVQRGWFWMLPWFLFWVALWFAIFNKGGRRASCELADRIGKGGGRLRRFLFTVRHNYMFGTLLVDKAAILGGQQARYTFDASDKTVVAGELAKGQGLVVLTAHIGSWELMGQMLDYVNVPVNIVMHEQVQEDVREMLTEGRDFSVLHTDGSPSAAAGILDALGHGEIVGMMGDRLLADEGVEVEFLGGRARFPIGPYAIAAAAGARVVYTFSIRKSKRNYVFRAVKAEVPKYTDRRNKRADLQRWAQHYATVLEGFLRERPLQWCNFYPFWETE